MINRAIVLKVLYIVLSIVFILFICFTLKFTPLNNVSIRQALNWCYLAPIPEKATIVNVEKSGGLAWKGYRIRFRDTPKGIKMWLNDSPGIKSAIYDPPSTDDRIINVGADGRRLIQAHNTYLYIITPKPGINMAEVNINLSFSEVNIYTYSD